MSAIQTHELYGLKIGAEPRDKPSPVLWTDSQPTVEVTFSNNSDVQWREDTAVHFWIEIDDDVVWSQNVEMGMELAPGETTTVTVETGPLTYEGHAVLGFSISSGININSEPRSLEPGDSTYTLHPTSAFSVWDRSHYVSTVKRPKQFQKGIIFTSIVLILFAGVQLWFAYFMSG
ncbi:hypothetical protein ACFQAS_14365 [Halopenitus salinus]|uniref:Uncharacterized protein n=1 Tax=Halopenitus salinus TaxID=1198295 RepID=A0ABD5UPJ7_9EURY